MTAKSLDRITIADINSNPVWRYVSTSAEDETRVQPVKQLPCKNLIGKIVGVHVILADGSKVWCLLGNIDVSNPRLTEHFLTASFERGGKWFHLARYHDYDYDERGPISLAAFLSKRVDDIFPIKYDVKKYSEGNEDALSGVIRREPRERLSRAEIIALAVP